MLIHKNNQNGLHIPTMEEDTVYYMEAQNGMLVRVPQSKLESWQAAQSSAAAPTLTAAEQRLRDRIMQDLYGSKK